MQEFNWLELIYRGDKDKMKKINEELASLGTLFGNKLLIALKTVLSF
jgi:Zn-dependent oligopeptidase